MTMGPPQKDPSTVDPLYLKYKLRGYSYYWKNPEKVKQKMRDRRLLINQHRPPLNLVCKNCNKEFTLPGMNKEGHKQHIIACCSTLCQTRTEKLKKLWIPKWLYNYYLDKKLWHFVVGFKQSKHSIFSPKRQLYGIKNLNFHNFFILWHPNSFLRKKYKWLDKLISTYQKWKYDRRRKSYAATYKMSPEMRRRHMQNIKAWQKRQPKDSNFAISKKFRSTVAGALKRAKGVRKNTRTQILLGTDFKTARAHMESLFKPASDGTPMTWKNHGLGWDKWHIDHIKPCKEFNLKIFTEQLECCYYKNLQPLWQKDNFDKRAKYEVE